VCQIKAGKGVESADRACRVEEEEEEEEEEKRREEKRVHFTSWAVPTFLFMLVDLSISR